MKEILLGLITLVLFSCCTSKSEHEDAFLDCTIEINNEDLIEAITEYQDYLYKDYKEHIERGDSIYVGILPEALNDSICRYYMYAVRGIKEIPLSVPFILSRVNRHYVLLSHASVSMWMKVRKERRFFKQSDAADIRYRKILFPEEFKEDQNGRWLDLYEPENCYLTFLGDSLIDKTVKRGFPSDKINIKLNGKEVNL